MASTGGWRIVSPRQSLFIKVTQSDSITRYRYTQYIATSNIRSDMTGIRSNWPLNTLLSPPYMNNDLVFA